MHLTFLKNIPRFTKVSNMLLPALSMMFGLQLLRVLIPQMVWLLGDRFALSAVTLGIIALLVFSFSFLTGVFRRAIGGYRLLVFAGLGLGLTRLLVQIPWGEPLITMLLSMVGSVLFFMFFSLHLDKSRREGNQSIAQLGIGILIGFILDTAFHGAFGTYDIIWQATFLPFAIIIALALIQWLMILNLSHSGNESKKTKGHTAIWLAFGPFIFLQTVVLQNIARQSVLTGWSQPVTFGWLLISQIAGLLAALLLLRKPPKNILPISLVTGLVLIAATIIPFPDQPWMTTVSIFAGQVSASILITLILIGTIRGNGSGSINVANSVGTLLLGILMLAYYTVYQINLPYNNLMLEWIAAIVIAVCAVIPALKRHKENMSMSVSWLLPALTLALLVVPLAGMLTHHDPQPMNGTGYPIKVMTYNLHNGFNPKGDLDLEALAEVIEEIDPDIVSLQEISRGWLISGRVDMIEWLSQRLDMPYVSGPTEGPLWGNAVLSRFPILESTNHELPPRDLFLLRGYLVTRIDIGNNEILNLIDTHFHHIPKDTEIRQQQVPILLQSWGGMESTVITGDLNAWPDSTEMIMMRDAGLVDVMADSEPPQGYTFNSIDPFERIDYIWITPDLEASNAYVPDVTASDHKPVVVELSR